MQDFLRAEAQAFVKHTPGTRLDLVGPRTGSGAECYPIVSMGCVLTPDELDYHAKGMAMAAEPVQAEVAFAA